MKRKKHSQPFDMDEVLIDATNLPHFDTQQFEGRLEHPIQRRTSTIVFLLFVLLACGFLLRTWELQVAEGYLWREHSEQNRLDHMLIFATRGSIYDRNGTPLSWNETGEATTTPYLKRRYIRNEGFGNLLGYVRYPQADTGGVYYQTTYEGIGGIESKYDPTLKGENGTQIIEENVLGNIVSEALIKEPKDGESLYLSIDAGVQSALYGAIRSLAERVGFEGGAGVIMDVSSGEVLALTSYPEIDSQILTDRDDTETIQTFLTSNRNYFLNRATSGLYTPGSIVKPFVGIAALEEKVINPTTQILSTGSISVPNPYDPSKETVFNDWKAHGWVALRDALAVSSNVYFFEIGGGYREQEGVGIEKLAAYFSLFGIGKETGIDLPGEAIGNIPTPAWKQEVFPEDPWRIGDTYNTAIGQYGFQVTPVQMARAVAAIANGGLLVAPHVVAENTGGNARLISGIEDTTLQIVREGMRQGVREGTARGLNTASVSVAGKTGTAELGSTKQKVNSWVMGFFPYEEPRYAFAVVMEEGPATNLIGSTFVMREVLDWMALNTPNYLK